MANPKIIFPNLVRTAPVYAFLMDGEKAEKTDFLGCCHGFELMGVHGEIPGTYWSENPTDTGDVFWYTDNIATKFAVYPSHHIAVFLDFANPLLTEEDTFDWYGNKVLKEFDLENTVVVCASQALCDHVKEQAPHSKTCWKFFKTADVGEIIARASENEYILLPTPFAYDTKALNSVPPQIRSRCIISVNDRCDYTCANFDRHLEASSKIAMMLSMPSKADFCNCYYGEADEYGRSHRSVPVGYRYAVDELMPLGYNIFYIASLGDSVHCLKETFDFLAKDDAKIPLLDALKLEWF